jgi:predicted DNA-binding protein
MSQFPIDVDAEAIFLDGSWFTREDLSRRIKAMLDSSDFNVARPSVALQELTQMMQGVRTLAFRSPPDLAESVNQFASQSGQTVGGVLREAVSQYLASMRTPRPLALAQSVSTANAESQISSSNERSHQPEPGMPDLPKVMIEASVVPDTTIVAGPGAMRSAGLEPVELTNKKKTGPTEVPDAVESRWFNQ